MTETFKNSLYEKFPAPLATEDDVIDFNIEYCLNAPAWIAASEECLAVEEAR